MTKLCEATRSLYEVTKPGEAVGTLDEVIIMKALVQSLDGPLRVGRIPYAPKFSNMALVIIGCKKNWL